jgi:hypothetical protein
MDEVDLGQPDPGINVMGGTPETLVIDGLEHHYSWAYSQSTASMRSLGYDGDPARPAAERRVGQRHDDVSS